MAIFKPLMNVEYVISLNDHTGTPTASKLDDKEQVLLRGQIFRPTKESMIWYAAPWQLEKIILAGVQPGEAFKVCRVQQGKSSEFTVTRLSDSGPEWPVRESEGDAPAPARTTAQTQPQARQAAGPAQPMGWDELPDSPPERQLTQSIVQAQQRKAQPPAPPQQQNVTRMPAPANYAPPPPVKTLVQQLLEGCLIASIDAALVAEQYAEKRGLEGFAFSPEDVRAMGITSFIQVTRQGFSSLPTTPQPQNGADQWQH